MKFGKLKNYTYLCGVIIKRKKIKKIYQKIWIFEKFLLPLHLI